MRKLKRLSRKYTDISRKQLKRFNFPSRPTRKSSGTRVTGLAKLNPRNIEFTKENFHPLNGHPFVLPVLTFMILFFVASIGLVLAGGQTIGASDSNIVTVTVDGQEQTVPTRAKTVADLLKRLNVEVNDKDIVEPALTTPILEDNLDVTVQKARPVTIVDGGKVTTVLSAHKQLRTVVKSAGVTLYPEDGITSATPKDITDQPIIGDQVVVDRATPANINLYGNNIPVRTRAKTVGELLEQKDIKTIPGDTIQPSVDTPITANTQVFIVRVGKQLVTAEEVIPAPLATVDDATLAVGATVVKEAGADGKKVVTYEVETQNGIETSRKVLQEVIAAEPVRRVVAKGTKVVLSGGRAEWLVAAGISPAEYYAVDYIVGRESGWCPTKWQGEYGGCPAYHGTPTSAGKGYGLCQATPGWKMASAGADWAVNPVTQLKWCTGYARGRYGSWAGAYNFWIVNHWW